LEIAVQEVLKPHKPTETDASGQGNGQAPSARLSFLASRPDPLIEGRAPPSARASRLFPDRSEQGPEPSHLSTGRG
jgi:hypothetical protein